ncbi:MAG: hypothetical protein WDM87_00450 [Terracidiphilus sp.]
MPLVHYREPRRGDIVVFYKPVFQPGLDEMDADGKPRNTPFSSSASSACPATISILRNGIVIPEWGGGKHSRTPIPSRRKTILTFSTSFRPSLQTLSPAAPRRVGQLISPNHVVDGDLGGSSRDVLHDGR